MVNFEEYKSLLASDRSVRRFDGARKVDGETLGKLVELARFCASGRNLQPLKYVTVSGSDYSAGIFKCLKWAGYLRDWDGPVEGERPAGYLVQCLDTELGKDCMCDDGLQLQAITLGAKSMGLGCCIIKAFDHVGISAVIGLDPRYVPLHVLAVGYPVEEVVIEDMDGTPDAYFKYYRTDDGIHHVPKRSLKELLIKHL